MILHIHDETMLKVISKVSGVTVNEIIDYNSQIGKNIKVIDIYRDPIERKMSHFFEELSSCHFNNSEKNLNSYSVKKIENRFNKVFPYIGIGDHYLEEYGLDESEIPEFDFEKKVMVVEKKGIEYIKLRLKDAANWGEILSVILKTEIIIRRDHETSEKPLGELYGKFKSQYVIPSNLLSLIKMEKSFNKFNTKLEKELYIEKWEKIKSPSFKHYTQEEYSFYKELSMENAPTKSIKYDHYKDNGCVCVSCIQIREHVKECVKTGTLKEERVVHRESPRVLSRIKMQMSL
jgi:hypothetical protein